MLLLQILNTLFSPFICLFFPLIPQFWCSACHRLEVLFFIFSFRTWFSVFDQLRFGIFFLFIRGFSRGFFAGWVFTLLDFLGSLLLDWLFSFFLFFLLVVLLGLAVILCIWNCWPSFRDQLFLFTVAILHFRYVFRSDDVVVNDRRRIVLADDAAKGFLVSGRGLPRGVDKFSRKVFELWAVLPDIGSLSIVFLVKCDWRIDPEVLMKESRCWKPLPVSIIECPVSVKKMLVKDASA